MATRTKRRAKFDFQGRPFVWWVDGDRWLRIASQDKHFVVAYPLGRAPDEPAVLVVHGKEFPRLQSASRPRYMVIPEPRADSMGACVEQLLRWCFESSEELVESQSPPQFS